MDLPGSLRQIPESPWRRTQFELFIVATGLHYGFFSRYGSLAVAQQAYFLFLLPFPEPYLNFFYPSRNPPISPPPGAEHELEHSPPGLLSQGAGQSGFLPPRVSLLFNIQPVPDGSTLPPAPPFCFLNASLLTFIPSTPSSPSFCVLAFRVSFRFRARDDHPILVPTSPFPPFSINEPSGRDSLDR